MFALNEYLKELSSTVTPDNDELQRAKDHVELTALICDDPWLSRQAYYGVAGAMERQIEYLGNTLLPNSEAKLQKMNMNGVMGESYTIDSWFGTANKDDPHINEEIALDVLIDDQETFCQGLRDRMKTAAIIFVCNMKAHDEVSKILDQLTYSGIKARAAMNKQSRTG
jgi:hypothetical protein